MSIHSTHPFATPAGGRDAARQFRGRLISPVTLWAAGQGHGRVGLTVSSVLVGLGEQARILGLLDPDSELVSGLGELGTVTILAASDGHLADVFAGLAPSPGGAFRAADFEQTAWGPVLPGRSWVGVRWESSRELGWSIEVVGVIEQVALSDADALAHVRGHYQY